MPSSAVRVDKRSITLPVAVRFPVELRRPRGFSPDRMQTWPAIEGRLEFVDGRLLYMPPSGGPQQSVAADVTYLLRRWTQKHPRFVVGTNETGMMLGGDVRAADVAVWRRSATTGRPGFRREPPVLAVEVAGEDEEENTLVDKAAWYVEHGCPTVWLVFPATREVMVVRQDGPPERIGSRGALTRVAGLPGLRVRVAELFAQLED